jgi:hypothetical protein
MSGRNNTSSRLRQASMKNFNPRLIFSQIVAMQCCHYLFLGILFQINHILYGQSITIDRMFTDEYIQIWHTIGWPDSFAVFLSYSIVGYVPFRFFLKYIVCYFCQIITGRTLFFVNLSFDILNEKNIINRSILCIY